MAFNYYHLSVTDRQHSIIVPRVAKKIARVK